MLRQTSLNLRLIIIGIVLIAIAFFSISLLPSQLESNLSRFFGTLGAADVQTVATYRRIGADRYFLQSIYIFLTGIVVLVVGLFKTPNR
ncbi:hypothetical protein [Nostoc sp. FACHB-110]|uniref:hypothetical protein n=1 Tax=Nostoc sp. FACHB-110 TaxID=2692834 RepID=UPI001684B6DB|nr:hypothetical protein [Nostoc sp. FACHB-110]MBD2435411.1 hypothetical protein [Nostoc sp. FACHB-110]